MYIFQPNRYLLTKQIKQWSFYIKGRVLDVGAGLFSRYQNLFKYDEYIKMDIATGDNVEVIGSVENIPFPNEYFDSIIMTEVLEHISSPCQAAKEIARVLKKNGICLITIPQTNELHEEPNDFFRYTRFGIEKIFNEVGFEVVECKQKGGFFTLIANMKIRYLIDRLSLYKHKWGRIFSKVFKIYFIIMYFFDQLDNNKTNRKHTIGWCFILRKL